ncbi:MAG: phage portal protein, partial [Sciscionella sp.]
QAGGPAGGVVVTPESSLQMSAVWRAVGLISSISASLPLCTYKKGTKKTTTTSLLDNPHPEMTAFELWRLNYVHRALWGNGYFQKVRNAAGQVTELHPIHPSLVLPGITNPIESNPGGKVYQITGPDGERHDLTPREILHIPGMGYDGVAGLSAIQMAAQGIGTALAAERYSAKLFGSGNLLGGILQVENRLKSEEADALQKRWQAKMSGMDRAHDVAVLDNGAKFQALTMPSTDAQLLESRQFAITDIGRFYGVPPFLMMQTEKSTSWGTGLEQQAQGFVTFDLTPQWLTPTESRLSAPGSEVIPRTQYVKYNVDALLRGDSAARAALYTARFNTGSISPNDIRDAEDEEPIEGGDVYLQPMNMVPLGTQPAPPAPAPAPSAPSPAPTDGGADNGTNPAGK